MGAYAPFLRQRAEPIYGRIGDRRKKFKIDLKNYWRKICINPIFSI